MKYFNVFDPNINIFNKFFLEASAGTGKTFTIEQLYIKLLLSEKDIDISKILIVTFTNAATNELKIRIKLSLEKILVAINNNDLLTLSKYSDNVDVKLFYMKIKNAISCFHCSQIFTIHGFCKMIIEKFQPGFCSENLMLTSNESLLIQIRKLFTSNKLFEHISEEQLSCVAKNFPNSLDKEVLHKFLSLPAQKTESLNTEKAAKHRLLSTMLTLKDKFQLLSKNELIDMFLNISTSIKGFNNRSKQIKSDIKLGILAFVNAILSGSLSGLMNSPIIMVNKNNLLKKSNSNENLSNILNLFEKIDLSQLLTDYSNNDLILESISKSLYREIYQSNQTITNLRPDDLLLTAYKIISTNPTAAKTIRQTFSGIMIDEFQDTDHIQWNIFQSLFIDSEFDNSVFLIGDPKQSIYGFRNADVYTYQRAKTSFQQENIYSLNYNYRSSPLLLSAINILFSTNNLFKLPRTCSTIQYTNLISAQTAFIRKQKNRNACHFIIENDELSLFKFIYHEIKLILKIEQIPLKNIAILTRDKNQGKLFIKHCPFPVNFHVNKNLALSTSSMLSLSIFKAINNPFNESILLETLSSPIFNVTLDIFQSQTIFYISMFLKYKEILMTNGALFLFRYIMSEHGATLLSSIDGEVLYHELEKIFEFINNSIQSEELIIPKLEEIIALGNISEDLSFKFSDPDEDALQIITIHSAKGLEYDVVFPIGVIRDHHKDNDFNKEEVEAEKVRQLYVAFTRAAKLLYIPIIKTAAKEAPISIASREIFKDYSVVDFVQRYNEYFSCSIPDTEIITSFNRITNHSNNIEILNLPYKPVKSIVYSFSSKADIHTSSNSYVSPIISKNDIPLGIETGIIIHSILEKISISSIKNKKSPHDLHSNIAMFLHGSPLQNYLQQISELVFLSFHTDIGFENAFKLIDIDERSITREFQFLKQEKPQEFSKGIIDLFIEHKNKYYIIDWKSNYLGDTASCYSNENLRLAVKDMEYDQQMNMYASAIRAYLASFNQDKQLAGYAIIFIRGLKYGKGAFIHDFQ